MLLNIHLNARFLGWRATGVGRYSREMWAHLAPLLSQDGRFRASAIAPGNPPAATLGELGSLPRPSMIGAVLWEQLILPLRARDGFLVNLSNTGPLAVRRQLVVIHDASVMAMPDNYSLAFRTWYKVALHALLRRARQVVTDSQFSRSELARRCAVPAERIEVVPCGCDHLDAVTPDPSILSRAGLIPGRYVLAVGTPSRAKNLALALEAMTRLGDPDLALAVVGEVEPRVFKANRIAWPAFARLLGSASDAELKALYQHALCFVFPSRYEGFGLPPLEAMRCGCPAVVSKAASLPEVCGDAALYVDPDDADGLARHIRMLADSGPARDSLRTLGFERARRYPWSAAAAKLFSLIAAASAT